MKQIEELTKHYAKGNKPCTERKSCMVTPKNLSRREKGDYQRLAEMEKVGIFLSKGRDLKF